MRRAYQAAINVRFAIDASNANDADALAVAFANNLAGWIDGSLGSPPFAPWLTAWYEDSVEQLALSDDQLSNWNAISDPLEPFDVGRS